MEVIRLEGTDETPKVVLDASANLFEFSGKSLPEDVTSFYNPLLEWLDEYANSPNELTKVIFRLDYFNTASSKMILDILLKMEEIQESGNNVLASWHYRDDDEDMQEAGEEYAEIVEIPFEQVSY
jgi:hypothetical protein